MLAELVTFSLYLDTEKLVPTGRNVFNVFLNTEYQFARHNCLPFLPAVVQHNVLCNIACYKKF
jgi:hypothetical protein